MNKTTSASCRHLFFLSFYLKEKWVTATSLLPLPIFFFFSLEAKMGNDNKLIIITFFFLLLLLLRTKQRQQTCYCRPFFFFLLEVKMGNDNKLIAKKSTTTNHRLLVFFLFLFPQVLLL